MTIPVQQRGSGHRGYFTPQKGNRIAPIPTMPVGGHRHEFAVDTGQCRWHMLRRRTPEKVRQGGYPAGAAANEWPSFPALGVDVDGAGRRCRNRVQANKSRRRKCGRKGNRLISPESAARLRSTDGGTLMPCRWTSKRRNPDEGRGNSWRYCHVKAKQPGQRGAGNVVAATEKSNEAMSNHWHGRGDVGSRRASQRMRLRSTGATDNL